MEEERDKLWVSVLREHPMEERTLGKPTFSWVSSSCLLPSSFMAPGAAHLQPHGHWHDYHEPKTGKIGLFLPSAAPNDTVLPPTSKPLVPGSRLKGTLGSALCRVGQHQSCFVRRVLLGCAFLVPLWKAKLFFSSLHLAISRVRILQSREGAESRMKGCCHS